MLISRFIIVGIFNTIFGYSIIFSSMYIFNFSPIISNFLGYSISFFVSFFMHKKFTFNSTNSNFLEIIRFLITFIISYFFNIIVLLIMLYIFKSDIGLSQVIAGFFYVIISFYLNNSFVFKKFNV